MTLHDTNAVLAESITRAQEGWGVRWNWLPSDFRRLKVLEAALGIIAAKANGLEEHSISSKAAMMENTVKLAVAVLALEI
jgi:hypothetical protein